MKGWKEISKSSTGSPRGACDGLKKEVFWMLVNKDVIFKLYEEEKIRKQEDLKEVFNVVFKGIIETIYQAELTETLGYSKYDKARKKTNNSRNGYNSKVVRSSFGEIELDVPRDRRGEYEPIIVKKKQRDITKIEEWKKIVEDLKN